MTKRKAGLKKSKVAELEARAEHVKRQLEATLSEGEQALGALWHQSAVAALHWVGSHRNRVTAFRKSVKGTPVERVVEAALKALRAEGRAPASRARSKSRRKTKARNREAPGAKMSLYLSSIGNGYECPGR